MKGPAPTGLAANAFWPIFCTAVGEAIQLAIESKIWLVNAPSGALRLICTVDGPVAVTEVTGQVGLQVQLDFRSRLRFHTTASALNGVPSVNFTPWRRVIVIDLPPLENLYPVARSGMIFPFGPSSNSSPKMASIWLWSAAPLMFVAGSRPAGQSPENPVHSSTVSVPPAFGAPLLACALVLELLLPPPQAATARPSSRAVPPRQNLRTVPDVPSLISLTHSISSVCDNK